MKTTQVRCDDYMIAVQHDEATETDIRRAAYKYVFSEFPDNDEVLEDYTEIVIRPVLVDINGNKIS